jgi:hypothetical protein
MNNIILEWNELLLDAIRITKPGPPMAARSIAIVYTSIYDAWAVYSKTANLTTTDFTSTVPNNRSNLEESISYAAYHALKNQFPDVQSIFDAKMARLGFDVLKSDTPPINAPYKIGIKAAKQVLSFRINDGANQLGGYQDTTGYKKSNPDLNPTFPSQFHEIENPDKWQCLVYLTPDNKPSTPGFIAPHWGKVQPFALTTSDQVRPRPPQHILSQGFVDQCKHVMDIQTNLTPVQKVIAEYWADGPNSELPPGHWTVFTAHVVRRDNLSLSETIKLFFAVSNAILDASIATWEAKRYYDYCRPITAIRHLFRGKTIEAWGGPNKGIIKIQGEAWRTFQVNTFPTPPFAEYTSGHSCFSMAAAQVLKLFTGSDNFDYFFTQTKPLLADPNEDVIGISIRWNTFTEAASEAGESRLYGGIHFYEGNVAGLDMGKRIGELAYQKAKQYWEGNIT